MKSSFQDEKKEKELKDIISDISNSIKENPSDANNYYARALQYYQLSQQYYDVLDHFAGGNLQIQWDEKEIYLEHLNNAYNDIEKALSFEEQNLDDYAYSFKLFILGKLKKWDELIEYGKKLYETVGLTDMDVSLIAEADFNIKDWEKCIKHYTYLIDRLGEKEAAKIEQRIFLHRGIAYLSLEKYDLALKDFFKHKKINIFNILDENTDELIATAYKNMGKYKEAIKYYTIAIKEDEENADLYFQRGQINCDNYHNYETSIKDFESAIKYAEEANYFYYHYLGYSSVHQGEIEEGKKNYKKALAYYDRAIISYKIAVPLDWKKQDGRFTVGYAVSLKNKLLKKIEENKNHKWFCK